MNLAWRQLRHRPVRLVVALLGIGFAVLLVLMQLGFRAALFESAVRFQQRFDYDIALFSPDSVFIVRPEAFSIRRVYQALADPEVAEVTPVYLFPAIWKNPWTHQRRSLNLVGFDPRSRLLNTPGFAEAQALLTRQDAVLFDRRSRPEFGDVAAALASGQRLYTEVNDRRIEVVGSFEMGTSFGIDGTLVTSDDNWLRLFPERSRNEVQLGLLRLVEGADPVAVRDRLRAALPEDVLVLTRADFVARETAYWNRATPIGYVFAFGAIMGFAVGAIMVYQILFADVSEHLGEYATLHAIGYPLRHLAGVVMQQAGILGVLGFVPGLALAHLLSQRAAEATSLPLQVAPERAAWVLLASLLMCAGSAVLALRKLRRIDPAEVF